MLGQPDELGERMPSCKAHMLHSRIILIFNFSTGSQDFDSVFLCEGVGNLKKKINKIEMSIMLDKNISV